MRFLGHTEAKTDVKGRVFLPAVFRKVLQASGQENLVLRKDIFQDCLVLYPESVWNEQMDMLRQRLNRFNAEHQRIFRQFVSEVEMVMLDGNVEFIGMGDTIEIWSAEKVEASKMSGEEFGKALENIMNISF